MIITLYATTIASCDDLCAKFVAGSVNITSSQCSPSTFADMQMSEQCVLEDDLDEFDAFPIFTKRSSRRLRRTSIKIYRKSLDTEQNLASEEECDTVSFIGDVENETSVADAEVHMSKADMFNVKCDQQTSESSYCVIPSIAAEGDVKSDVPSVNLPSTTSFTSALKSENGMSFS